MKRVIIIAGPTASGKTAAAIELARGLNTEIISADSRQCYRELEIGVARPSPEELSAVPHHFIATHSIHQKITVASFEAFALEKADQLFQRLDTIVMVGGTGLYIDAFCEGLDEIPEVPEAIHQQIIEDYRQYGLAWLQQRVAEADPRFYGEGEIRNPHRLTRALEVITATGQSILHFRRGTKAQRPFQIDRYALELPREELHRNIHRRVDRMMEQGLEEEARSLGPCRHLNALQTVGYKELFAYFEGSLSREEAVEQIKRNTRQYAKRQLTWFRRDQRYRWLSPREAAGIILQAS